MNTNNGIGLLLLDASDLFKRELVRFYDKGFDWILAAGPRILLSAVVLVTGFWIIRLLRSKLNKRMRKGNVHSSLRPFFASLVFTALHVTLIFLVMQILGIKLTVFAAVIAAFGAAAGLALSGTLQNFASGILILLLKPFITGDNIIAQGVEGTVTSIQIFYTVITTFDNKTVIMPNSKLSNEVIVNITHQGVRRLSIELKFKHSIAYNSVKNVLAKLFTDIKEVCELPATRIGVSNIDKEDYTVQADIWVNAHGLEDSRLMINERIVNTLHDAGIYEEK